MIGDFEQWQVFSILMLFEIDEKYTSSFFYRKEYHVYYFNYASTRHLNLYGIVDRTFPSTHFWNPNTRRGSSVGSMSALYANSPNIEPRVRLSWIFPSYAYLRKASCQLLAKRMGTTQTS